MSTLSTATVDRPAPPPRRWTVARVAGHVLVAFWLLLIGGLLVYLVRGWDPALFDRYAGNYLSGLLVTLQLVGLSILLGAVLSVPLAYGRITQNAVLSALAYAYVYCFRGTPLIAQAFLIYYGLGSFRQQLDAVGLWWFFRDAWNCALFAFTLNTAAYQAEILRGAIQSVGRGQWEGAAALGLNKWQTLRRVIIPQALIVALRPYGNEIILMIKGSAIVAIITVYDLMGETRRAYSRTFDFQTYLYAAFIYLGIVETLRHIVDWLERRLTRHMQR